MVHAGWSGFSANWEVRTETPFSVMTRSGFTFRMSSQTRRISSYGVGFFLRSKLFPAVPWKKGPLFYFKESCLPTIIFQVPSCQYWSTGSYYLRSSPPLAAGAFPSRILWWSRHWFDLGSIADFTETSQGRFLEMKVLFTHLDSMEKLWAKLLSPFLYSRGQSSKTTLFTGCFMKTQHLAFEMG